MDENDCSEEESDDDDKKKGVSSISLKSSGESESDSSLDMEEGPTHLLIPKN